MTCPAGLNSPLEGNWGILKAASGSGAQNSADDDGDTEPSQESPRARCIRERRRALPGRRADQSHAAYTEDLLFRLQLWPPSPGWRCRRHTSDERSELSPAGRYQKAGWRRVRSRPNSGDPSPACDKDHQSSMRSVTELPRAAGYAGTHNETACSPSQPHRGNLGLLQALLGSPELRTTP